MMSPLRLEVFEDMAGPTGRSRLSREQGAVEEAKLASYEQGYAASTAAIARDKTLANQ